MTWANTWEMMIRTFEAFATRNTDTNERGGKLRKTFKKPKEFKDDSDGCIDTWVEVMRLHLEQDNLNDERQTCRMDCPLFWEAVKNQSHPKHKLALAAVQNTRNRQAEFDTKNSEAPSAELPTKTVKAVAQVKNAIEAETSNSLEINYEKAAAEAIDKVKQDLATKEIEQRLTQEIERQKLNETLSRSVPIPEAEVGATRSRNCNTLKMVTGKPFGITKSEPE